MTRSGAPSTGLAAVALVGIIALPARMAMVMSGLLAANNLAVFIAPHVSTAIGSDGTFRESIGSRALPAL